MISKSKVCPRCHKALKSKGDRIYCPVCEEVVNLELGQAARDLNPSRVMARNAAMLLAAGGQYGNAVKVVDGIVDLHGGPEGFVASWYDQWQLAAESSPGSRYVLDHFEKISRLMILLAEHRPGNADVEGMEQEDVQNELNRILGVLPAVAVESVEDEDD